MILPWPPQALYPNVKSHWAVKARATKSYRHAVKMIAMGSKPKIDATIIFHPKSPLMDDDNMIAAFKAGRDGLADAWGINDNKFRFKYKFGEPVKGGKIIVNYGENHA